MSWDARHWRMVDRHGGLHDEEELPPTSGYVPLYRELLEAIDHGANSTTQARGYARDTAIVQAAYASARQRAEVDLRAPEWTLD